MTADIASPRSSVSTAGASNAADVLVLGGGPGGATVATRLAQLGRRVLVLEKDRFPRFHIGESLLPRSREIFDKLGLTEALDQRFLRKYGARFLCCDTRRISHYRFAEAFRGPFEYAYHVQRAEFDELVLERAEAAGAEVRQEWRATEILWDGDRAVGVKAQHRPEGGAAGPVEELRAPVIADCTGRASMLATRLRTKSTLARLDKTAMFTHYEGAWRESGQDEGNIQIIIFEHGWFWFIPFRGRVTSVGAVVSSEWMKTKQPSDTLDDFFERTIQHAPFVREFLEGATKQRPVQALADFSYRVEHLAGDGWLLAGDSGGFLDPLFSTGAHLAFKSGDLAADAIDRALTEGDVSRAAFADYETSIREAANLFLGVVQGFYAGEFRELLFAQDQRRVMRQIITSILSGDVFHEARKPHWVGFVQQAYPARMSA